LHVAERLLNLSQYALVVIALTAKFIALVAALLQIILGLFEVTLHCVLSAPAVVYLALVKAFFMIAFGARSANRSCHDSQ
jgi:hypothetical protein